MCDFMLLTASVTHNLNIINDISSRRLDSCYFVDVVVFRSPAWSFSGEPKFRAVFV